MRKSNPLLRSVRVSRPGPGLGQEPPQGLGAAKEQEGRTMKHIVQQGTGFSEFDGEFVKASGVTPEAGDFLCTATSAGDRPAEAPNQMALAEYGVKATGCRGPYNGQYLWDIVSL